MMSKNAINASKEDDENESVASDIDVNLDGI